jgi:hypothetical protein
MAGRITVSTLNDDTGVLATQNGMSGIAKAWVSWTGSTGATLQAFNVSSVTRVATGRYTVSFTTAMPNTTYAVVTGADLGTYGGLIFQNQAGYTTTSINELQSWRNDTGGTLFDCTRGYVAVYAA